MADEWYYRLLGVEFGPVSFEFIVELAQGGELTAESEVRQGEDGEWQRADQIVGLLPEPEEVHDLSELNFEFEDNSKAVAARTVHSVRKEVPAGAAAETDFECKVELETAPKAPAPPVITSPPAADSEWYCRILGQELGPMAFDALQELVRQNELSANDTVRCGATGTWVQAGTVRNLFPKTAPPKSAAPVPAAAPKPSQKPAGKKKPRIQEADVLSFLAEEPKPVPSAAPPRTATPPAAAKPAAAETTAMAAFHTDPELDNRSLHPPAAAAPTRPAMPAETRPNPFASAAAAVPTRAPTPVRPPAKPSRSSKGSSGGLTLPSWANDIRVQAAVVGVLLLWGVWYFSRDFVANLTVGSTQEHYERLEKLYTEFGEIRNRSSKSELADFRERAKEEQQSLISELQRTATPDNPAARELLAAARYDLAKIIGGGDRADEAEKSFEKRLEKAAELLKGGGGSK